MKYTIAAHPTMYAGVQFRSRLEARWAAFFDIAGFTWEYEPVDFKGWTPDFKITVPCRHSDCGGGHVFWVEVKPYDKPEQFNGHAVAKFNHPYVFPAVGLGINPHVETTTEFVHGDGGGEECLSRWVPRNIDAAWKQAGNIVQWRVR